MNHIGLQLACRYAFPPNRLHLCGPDRQQNIEEYTKTGIVDLGTYELLTQFSTFYPYLQLIAAANLIKDPFDPTVVEAYWIGNSLLNKVKHIEYIKHLDDSLGLKQKLTRTNREELFTQVSALPLPHHNFHVCAIWQRTGNISAQHSIESMDACIINWGTVISTHKNETIVSTQALTYKENKLVFRSLAKRKLLSFHLRYDTLSPTHHTASYQLRATKLSTGTIVSYHWGVVCDILTPLKLKHLKHYTNLALSIINS